MKTKLVFLKNLSLSSSLILLFSFSGYTNQQKIKDLSLFRVEREVYFYSDFKTIHKMIVASKCWGGEYLKVFYDGPEARTPVPKQIDYYIAGKPSTVIDTWLMRMTSLVKLTPFLKRVDFNAEIRLSSIKNCIKGSFSIGTLKRVVLWELYFKVQLEEKKEQGSTLERTQSMISSIGRQVIGEFLLY